MAPDRQDSTTPREAWIALATVLCGTVVGTFGNGVAGITLPDVLAEFGIAVSLGAWYVTSFVLALAVCFPALGRLADVAGTRRVYLWSLAGFLVASAAVALAPTYGLLLAARVAQGISGAAVLPTVMVIVVALFPEHRRGAAMGTWAAVNGAALALAPLVAGLLTEAVSWRAVFWLIVALTALTVAVTVRWLPDIPAERGSGRFDAGGAILLTGALVAVMIALSRAPAWGWLAGTTVAMLVASAGAFGGFVLRARRHADPFFDLAILRRRAYALPSGIAGLQALVLYGILLVTPLMFLHVFGFSVAAAGALVFLLPVSIAVASPAVGGLTDRFGPRAVMTVGTVLLAVGNLLVASAVFGELLAVALAGTVVVGIGVAAIQSPAAVSVAAAVDASTRGSALGMFHTIRFLSGVVGATLFAVLLEAVARAGDLATAEPRSLRAAFAVVLVTAAGAAGGATILCALLAGRPDCEVAYGAARPPGARRAESCRGGTRMSAPTATGTPDAVSLWRGIAIGVFAGGLSGMFGVGGGVLIVPALALFAHLSQRLAHGTSLAATGPLALAGVIGYALEGSVDWAVAACLASGAIGGALIGTAGLQRLPDRALRIGFAVLLFATAIRMFVAVPDATGRPALTVVSALGLVAIGLFSGTIAGLMGVGGGIIMVPAQIVFFGIPDALAKGTSLAVIVPTAMMGTARNRHHRNIDLRGAAAIAGAGAVTSFLASKVAVGLDPALSSALFAVLLTIAAARLLWTSRRRRT